MRVLNFGSLNIDYVYRVDSFVKPGETKAARSLSVYPGGKGLNQSLAMARAGIDVAHAGRVGKEGAFLIETLRSSGVDTSCVETAETATGHAIIQVDDAGSNCILLFGGANRMMETDFIDRVLSGFGRGDMLVLQNEISGMAEIMSRAKARGMTIALNPSPYEKGVESYPLGLVDIFLLNEIEAEGISGENDEEAAAARLGERFPSARVIITLGARGSLCMDRGVPVRQKAYRAKAVDTTAAGDTFSGYFLAGLIEGMDTAGAMDLAARAAALCVTRKGAADSVPFRSEL